MIVTSGPSDREAAGRVVTDARAALGPDRAPFIVESVRPLAEIRQTGALALSLRWRLPSAPPADAVRAVTGFAIGGVAPVGHLSPLPVWLDPRLLDFPLV